MKEKESPQSKSDKSASTSVTMPEPTIGPSASTKNTPRSGSTKDNDPTM